jgi:acylphosphatase
MRVKRLHATVSGRVQGVGFREYVRYEATSRGLTGFVRNCEDGRSVEVVAEGDEQRLAELAEALHGGPRFARVERVDAEMSEGTLAFGRFSIEF